MRAVWTGVDHAAHMRVYSLAGNMFVQHDKRHDEKLVCRQRVNNSRRNSPVKVVDIFRDVVDLDQQFFV